MDFGKGGLDYGCNRSRNRGGAEGEDEKLTNVRSEIQSFLGEEKIPEAIAEQLARLGGERVGKLAGAIKGLESIYRDDPKSNLSRWGVAILAKKTRQLSVLSDDCRDSIV